MLMERSAWAAKSGDPCATSASLKRSGRGKEDVDLLRHPRSTIHGARLHENLRRHPTRHRAVEFHRGSGGIADVRKHKWFKASTGPDFDECPSCRTARPKIRGPNDASNFDKFEPRVSISPDEISGWDNDF
uniref:AGC-kinase C-terminal domain-containing protein n=1 Tax=Macrostomum lignano TaxID=282301 RepID=A0A1I8FTA5_9PLAT